MSILKRLAWVGGGLFSLTAFAADVPLPPLQQLAQQTKILPPSTVNTNSHPAWHSTISAGFSLARGNTETMLVNANLYTERKSAINEWMLGAGGAYGDDHSVKSYESLNGFGQFNHFFTRRLYGYVRLDALHDGIKDIKYRATLSTGFGYYLLQRTNTTFALETGPSFVTERQGDQDQNYAAWRVAERYEYKFNSRARIWHSAEFIPEVDQTDNYVINAELGVESAIAKDLALRVYLLDNFVNQPTPGYKHNDIRIVSGISYKF
jgi:putative salt-induced outer membrane protein YdiY